jgi:hypothetical protein
LGGRVLLGLERLLADSETLHGDTHLAVHPEDAKPVLGLGLGRVGKADGRAGEREYESGVF